MEHKHDECLYYIELDCEKGICGCSKAMVPLDGEGSKACPHFAPMPKCGNCKNFHDPDKYGVGLCTGLEKDDWAYASCGAQFCPGYCG